MIPQWRREIWRVVVVVGVCFLVGLFVGAPFVLVSVALAGYLAWHFKQALDFVRWLSQMDADPDGVPDSDGLWSLIYRRVSARVGRLRERSEILEEQLDKYRQVARALPDAAVAFNRNGDIELINDAAARLLGLREPQDLGRPVKNLIRDPQFVDYLNREQFESPLEITSPTDPETTLSISVVPYGERDKQLLLARDTSRLHRLERMRQDFIANVSHEMKSPLTVIKGYVENLMDAPETDGKWSKPLSQIDQQTDRMCSIVEDLMALSNLETGPAPEARQAVDVPALIRSVVSEARELSQDRHRFDCEVDRGPGMLGSFNELYSAFSNLVFNAVSYTNDGGLIRIRWGLDSDGRARFSVTDTGVGIAPEHIPRLTERFYRVDQARSRELGGTGLGLAIVKHVLMRHGGKLEVDSEVGKGSTFALVFPVELVQPRDRDNTGLSPSAA